MNIFWKLDLKGVNSGFTQFDTKFTNIFRQFLALNRKQFFFEKTVLVIWSQICEKKTNESVKLLWKKVSFQVFKCFVFSLFVLFFKVTFWTTIAILSPILDHISKQVFPKYSFLFSIKISKLSRNMHKLRNSPIWPP